MADETKEREAQRVRELVEDYRRRGYEVTLRPSILTMPGVPIFPSGYEPDLVAKRGDECVVVEVRSGETLGQSPAVTAIAQAVMLQPGWTFELAIAESASAESASKP